MVIRDLVNENLIVLRHASVLAPYTHTWSGIDCAYAIIHIYSGLPWHRVFWKYAHFSPHLLRYGSMVSAI